MVQIYYLNVGLDGYSDQEKETIIKRALPRLHPERQEKVERIRFLEDRLCSVGAGLLFARGLSDLGIDGQAVVIGYQGNQKPFLPEHPAVHFNLSHSGTMAMAVFSDREVGCDIEQAGTADLRVARRFFHPREREMLEALERKGDGKGLDDLFFRIWTRKESVLKVTGEGIRMPMSSFCVCPGEPHARYTFLEHPVFGCHSCTCVDGTPGDVFFSFQNLADVV